MRFEKLINKNIVFFSESRNIYFLILLNIAFSFVFVVIVNSSFVNINSIFHNIVVNYIYLELLFIGYFYFSIVKIALYLLFWFITENFFLQSVHEVIVLNSFLYMFIFILGIEIITCLSKKRLWTILALIRIFFLEIFLNYL